jgi:hypothetical protein
MIPMQPNSFSQTGDLSMTNDQKTDNARALEQDSDPNADRIKGYSSDAEAYQRLEERESSDDRFEDPSEN